ncbi:HNH endonuclease signature motif containing protein [Tsukamurella tyrosinosolvens]|uniref:HNH endonuclease signature motif containing protein n=1 Tax=Tsukamurella tyrosinosolvens TaxID=57704 RepID=UPI000C7F04AD|nr:HNH endonuclease signature motif containing protein [Tsukamurella tyrosinosolvens]
MVLPGTDKFDGSTMFGSCIVIEQEYDERVNGSGALANLPKALLPSVLVDGTPGSGALGSILLEQRRCENVAFCRTMSAVYALFRDRYGERESAFLASDPIGGADFYAERRELSVAYEAVKAEVSVALRIGPSATETVIEQAVGFVERLPRVFALVGRNVLSPRGGTEALSRARALTGGQAIEFDELLAELLAADPLALISVPALREAADRLVHEIDPVAAERRRRMAEEDRRVTFRPAEDGMAAAYALLTAHEGLELGVRVDEIAGTVCESDPRTVPQRRADGLMMLVRGFSTLGCWCAVPGCPLRESRAVGDDRGDDDHAGARVVTRYRTLIHVVVNEKTLTDPGDTDAGFLIGHGPITAQHARNLAARDDAVLRPFGEELPDASEIEKDGAAAQIAAPSDPEANRDIELGADGAGTASARADAVSDSVADAACTAGTSDAADPTQPAADEISLADVDHDRDHDRPESPARPSPRRPRAAWFRATGIDLTHREPAGVLLAARCCHAGPTVITDSEAEAETDDAPESASDTLDQEPATAAEATATECDSSQRVDEPAAEVQRTALPTPTPATAVSPRALVIAQGSTGYRFSADLTRYLTLLYPRCVFPLCTRPASRCQLDHAREYDHHDPTRGGATTAGNGQPLCVPHHQLKTAGLWTDARLPDGRILWIGPTGQRIIVDPTRTIAALFPDLTRITWTTPTPAGRRKPPPPSGPTRLQKEHARRERLRAAHLDALTSEREERERVSPVEHHLETVLAGRDPAHHPPPDEPPPF